MVGQRDLGSSLLFFALFVVMMWVATERASYLVIGLRAVRRRRLRRRGGCSATSRPASTSGSTRGRDRLDSGYQIVQALYGLSDGGIAGTGLGLGQPEHRCPRRRTTSSSRRSARSSACSARRPC